MSADFKERMLSVDGSLVKRAGLDFLQVNLGDRCNQQCSHCHVDAGPFGEKIMSKAVMDDVLGFLLRLNKRLTLDITGGCPELNPHLRYFIERSPAYAAKVIVRNNLTILLEPGMEGMGLFYKEHKVKLICSLPCYTRENVDKQRGRGIFDASIEALRGLNLLGYAKESDLELDLVYNPGGGFLPGEQSALEKDYKQALGEQYGVVFNRLLTITNAPIKRFREYLQSKGELESYTGLLKDSFNREVAGNVMCRSLLSVGWDGRVYDCDFNQALGLAIRDICGGPVKIGELDPGVLEGREIIFGSHCFCCTAGAGSSCQGILKRQR